MHVIKTRNVHDALPMGIDYLLRHGTPRETRNGDVIVAPGPVTTVYEKPVERVMLHSARDANPFFHLFEALWMLDGRWDVAYVARFVPGMARYSDDGIVLHGAYGRRWREFFLTDDSAAAGNIDQVLTIIHLLKENHSDRRCVLQMWDPASDLGLDGKDVPCNTQAYFSINGDGKLDMTVCCRSNDIIWGAYGANAVHFSFLQEFIAAGVGVPVGKYWQISNNYHAYLNTLDPLRHLADLAPDPFREQKNLYEGAMGDTLVPLVHGDVGEFLSELRMFIDEGLTLGMRDPFLRRVATPMLRAHTAYKEGTGRQRYTDAISILESCKASDWRFACQGWLNRRLRKFDAKTD